MCIDIHKRIDAYALVHRYDMKWLSKLHLFIYIFTYVYLFSDKRNNDFGQSLK